MTDLDDKQAPKPQRHFSVPQRQQHRRWRLWLVTLVGLLVGLGYGLYARQVGSAGVETNDAYIAGNIVPLKAQTSGTVVDVRTDNTQYVRQGDVLVRLDGLQTQVALERAEANLADRVRQIETLFNHAEMFRQKLAGKEAVLGRSRHDLARYRSVAHDGAVSAQQLEDSEFLIREQEADVRQIAAELAGAKALVQNTTVADNPTVLQAIAELKQAYLDNVRQEIVAPLSGFVAKRSIQPGEQVRPDTPLLAIVPLDYLWVEANFLENELAHVQPGQPVQISVDLYGSEVVYHGEVLGLEAGTGSVFGLLPPDNATGNYIHIVERVPVRISLQAEELQTHPLRPGLSATVRIDTRQPGKPIPQPLTGLPAAYKTEVYDHQLQGAEALVKKIIGENRQVRKLEG
ncbi:efflux RND transporter periplasmic adaptor subunit [Methylovulum psychrotolerans]|uniref:Membrane fusion protein of tripartite multidrug resistance system n=1 Tax=Methylovulum psychrotolerans TaxID=1704499 RepID=A0A2S5CS99_9GAMM|nr:HlyD family efflux transporter periplasmic adaptor subunit [Methylovulum psychrotolerans]POZ53656.1 membrane fusion protein of tripartite multidrug resistance system [Methylovulum psychrotolerans]